MAKFRFELNREGVSELLKSQKMQEILAAKAEQISGAVGDGYKAETKVYKRRAVAEVRADTPKAYYSNLKHNTLLKALGGAKSD